MVHGSWFMNELSTTRRACPTILSASTYSLRVRRRTADVVDLGIFNLVEAKRLSLVVVSSHVTDMGGCSMVSETTSVGLHCAHRYTWMLTR